MTSGGNFTLQGRTVKALDENGGETAATVFSAFAAKDSDSDHVYIAMNNSRSGTYMSELTNHINNMQQGMLVFILYHYKIYFHNARHTLVTGLSFCSTQLSQTIKLSVCTETVTMILSH